MGVASNPNLSEPACRRQVACERVRVARNNSEWEPSTESRSIAQKAQETDRHPCALHEVLVHSLSRSPVSQPCTRARREGGVQVCNWATQSGHRPNVSNLAPAPLLARTRMPRLSRLALPLLN